MKENKTGEQAIFIFSPALGVVKGCHEGLEWATLLILKIPDCRTWENSWSRVKLPYVKDGDSERGTGVEGERLPCRGQQHPSVTPSQQLAGSVAVYCVSVRVGLALTASVLNQGQWGIES